MEIRLEGKTLAVGILLGVIITIALGADVGPQPQRPISRLIDTSGGISATADKTDYGLSMNGGAMALVRTQNGDFFIVSPVTGMATRVLHARRVSDDPTRSNRDYRGKQFNYSVGVPIEEEQGGGYGK